MDQEGMTVTELTSKCLGFLSHIQQGPGRGDDCRCQEEEVTAGVRRRRLLQRSRGVDDFRDQEEGVTACVRRRV